jgi:aryl-alcohol dehydrogenase-like predicted oxidoreductase
MPAEMTYRQLGPSGLTVSTVGIGCNNFGARMADEDVPTVVHAAIDAGITLFDTATSTGTAGARRRCSGGPSRVAATRSCWPPSSAPDMGGANGPDWGVRGSRRYIRLAVENSLRRLGTDWIDLYQLHTPDPRTPVEETLAALTELVAEGKVRYVGSSNLAGWQVVDADWTAHTGNLEGFVSAQNEYSWLNRGIEAELVPALQHTGQSLLPFFPLASGLLTGKYRRARTPRTAPGWPAHPTGWRPPTSTSSRRSASSPTSAGSPCCRWRSAAWRPCRPSAPSSPAPPRWSRSTPTWRRGSGSRPRTTSTSCASSRRDPARPSAGTKP